MSKESKRQSNIKKIEKILTSPGAHLDPRAIKIRQELERLIEHKQR